MRYPLPSQFPITDNFAAHVARNSKAPGVDIACPSGTPVLAVADGYVTDWGHSEAGGAYVWLRHRVNGRWASSYYCHLSEIAPGTFQYQHVRAGQVIGVSGNTGNSTGPHLHCAVRVGREWVDPETLWKGETK